MNITEEFASVGIAESQGTIDQARALTINTISARTLATELLDSIRSFRKQSDAKKEEVCRPLKTAWEEAKQPFDSFKKECEKWEADLQRKMGEWDREQDRLARIEQAKLQAKIDAENAKKLAKAEAKGIDPAEVVLKVAPVVQVPVKTVTTSAGTSQTRIAKTVYGIKGAVDNEDLTANDPRVKALLENYKDLFMFDWVKFRKIASTGMLDQYAQVESRTEYTYSQRGGK